MGKNKKVKFTTNIDKELLKKIKVKAINEEKNVNEIIEKLLQEYLKGE
jgi:predicted HicB family RNase H-like nuclease